MQKISSYNCNFPTLNRAQHYAFVHYYNSETPTHTHTRSHTHLGGCRWPGCCRCFRCCRCSSWWCSHFDWSSCSAMCLQAKAGKLVHLYSTNLAWKTQTQCGLLPMLNWKWYMHTVWLWSVVLNAVSISFLNCYCHKSINQQSVSLTQHHRNNHWREFWGRVNSLSDQWQAEGRLFRLVAQKWHASALNRKPIPSSSIPVHLSVH